MPVNIAVVGQERQPPTTRTWDSTRAILDALGAGAGRPDPQDELVFTAEDGVGGPQLALPTFATVLVPWRLGGDLGDSRLGSMSGRMSATVTPGDTLTVAVWRAEPGRAPRLRARTEPSCPSWPGHLCRGELTWAIAAR